MRYRIVVADKEIHAGNDWRVARSIFEAEADATLFINGHFSARRSNGARVKEAS